MNYNPPTPFIKGENIIIKIFILVLLYSCIFIPSAWANSLPDADRDGVPDKDEIGVYFTDPNKGDTDGDGYSDWTELNKGFSLHVSGAVKLEDSDFDKDGLSDRDELRFKTNLTKADTDGDTYLDGDEVARGYDPNNSGNVQLKKRIEINTKTQKLSYFLGDVKRGEFIVSTGKASMPTPKGNFLIDYKAEKAWSGKYGLWMPFWMSLKNGIFGIHELPEWPNGYKEGENHLGTAVSHGCIRLGIGSAKTLYEWAPMGTPVTIF